MSDALAKVERQRRREEPREKLPAQERYALKKLQREAKDAGAELASNGEGGLPPSLVLGVMRRDGYRCKGCGEQKMLGVHHKGHLENPPSKWLAAKGRANDPNNIVTLCTSCHDRVHERDREAGK
jgi:5-methylcytosine-specific restriction endonuclease McrA